MITEGIFRMLPVVCRISFITGQISLSGSMNSTQNLTCGGHRRHSYRSADQITTVMVSQSLRVYYRCFIHS